MANTTDPATIIELLFTKLEMKKILHLYQIYILLVGIKYVFVEIA